MMISQQNLPATLPAIKQPIAGCMVQELRQMLGLSQRKFAAQIGVTFPTLNRWEKGYATPSPLALKQIETLLNQLSNSPDEALRQQSQTLRAKYFPSGTLEV